MQYYAVFYFWFFTWRSIADLFAAECCKANASTSAKLISGQDDCRSHRISSPGFSCCPSGVVRDSGASLRTAMLWTIGEYMGKSISTNVPTVAALNLMLDMIPLRLTSTSTPGNVNKRSALERLWTYSTIKMAPGIHFCSFEALLNSFVRPSTSCLMRCSRSIALISNRCGFCDLLSWGTSSSLGVSPLIAGSFSSAGLGLKNGRGFIVDLSATLSQTNQYEFMAIQQDGIY